MKLPDIQARLLQLGIYPTLLFVISLSAYFILYHYHDLQRAVEEKGKISITQLALFSVNGITTKNIDHLKYLATALINQTDIVSIEIYDDAGILLTRTTKNSLPQVNKIIFFEKPITISLNNPVHTPSANKAHNQLTSTEKTVGHVKIGLSLINTQNRQRSYLNYSLVIICLGIIFTILFAIRISKKISLPIINLIKTANDLAEGNMNARATGSDITEISDLCQSFNTMAIGLQQTHNYLKQQVDIAVTQLNRTLSHLEEKNKSLEKTTKLAIAQNKTKSQFIAHISHEIRTPMNGILGFIELLSISDLSLQQYDQVQLINKSAISLLNIVNEILDYTSLETGNFKINISTFDFRENIENSATLISPASDEVKIIIDIDNDIPNLISTDPIRLQQIITNLVGNACKFTHTGSIIIRCRLLASQSILISISDTGIGVYPEKFQDLFQPFLQTSEYAVNNELGTGLGLTISKNIIERLNGSIGVSSKKNIGSTFWINLPISTIPSEPVETKPQTICVIDSFGFRRAAFIKQLLHLKYKVIGYDSIQQKNQRQYDLVFYLMPPKTFNLNELQEEIELLTKAKVIFISPNPNLKTASSTNVLSLPCRTSHLKNVIELFCESKQFATKSTLKQYGNRKFSIFIADDNEINRLLLKSQLEPFCRPITLAKDGKIAQSLLLENRYDLILLDLQMPYFSGVELISIVKAADSINKDSPVIAITAHAQKYQRKKLIEKGFDECLIKPILLAQWLEIIQLWLPSLDSGINSTKTNNYVSTLLEKTAENKKLTKNLFNILFTELQEQIELILKALDSKDYSRAEKITHKLHGSVSFCGFSDIQTIAKELEINLSEKNIKNINSNFKALKIIIEEFIQLKDAILKLL